MPLLFLSFYFGLEQVSCNLQWETEKTHSTFTRCLEGKVAIQEVGKNRSLVRDGVVASSQSVSWSQYLVFWTAGSRCYPVSEGELRLSSHSGGILARLRSISEVSARLLAGLVHYLSCWELSWSHLHASPINTSSLMCLLEVY